MAMYKRSWKELVGLSACGKALTWHGDGPNVDISVSVVGAVCSRSKNWS